MSALCTLSRSAVAFSRRHWAHPLHGSRGSSVFGVRIPLVADKRHNVKIFRAFNTTASLQDTTKEYVIVGGGNAAGYAAKAFVDNGKAQGKLLIIGAEGVAPYERPTLSKAYLFPLDQKPARLPGFHTTVGGGGDKQTVEWYKEQGIEVLLNTKVTKLDTGAKTVTTESGDVINYGTLILATGSTSTRLPADVGGSLPGVEYIRDVADADSLIKSLEQAKKVVIVGGGYIGLEVGAAATAWNLDTTMVFPEEHVMPRLFTKDIAAHYQQLYQSKGVKFLTGKLTKKFVAGGDGRVAKVELDDGTVLDADLVVVGVGAKPVVAPFLEAGLQEEQKGIQVDGVLKTSAEGVYAVGDIAAFPLKMYSRTTRVEHVDHARKSAQHCANAICKGFTDEYDYLPYFYSRVFEHPQSDRKLWWQFYGDNVGETVLIGDFKPKLANFWIDNGKLKGVFLESGSPEEFALLPKLARAQPAVDLGKLKAAQSVEAALEVVKAGL